VKGRNLSQAASMMWMPNAIMYFIVHNYFLGHLSDKPSRTSELRCHWVKPSRNC